MSADPEHVRQLSEHNEEAAYKGDLWEATYLSREFSKLCVRAAEVLGLGDLTLSEVEILKGEPNSSGQYPHLDSLRGIWVFFAPLVASAGTTVKDYFYQKFPENVGPHSSVPRHWGALPDINIGWEVGDIFVLRSNAIHGGPPSGPHRRYVLFAAEQSTKQGEYSDTSVVFEGDFFAEKQAFREAQFARLQARVLEKKGMHV